MKEIGTHISAWKNFVIKDSNSLVQVALEAEKPEANAHCSLRCLLLLAHSVKYPPAQPDAQKRSSTMLIQEVFNPEQFINSSQNTRFSTSYIFAYHQLVWFSEWPWNQAKSIQWQSPVYRVSRVQLFSRPGECVTVLSNYSTSAGGELLFTPFGTELVLGKEGEEFCTASQEVCCGT